MRKAFTVLILLISLCALFFFVHRASSDQVVYIRTFDLGGSGLKTALLSYDKNSGTMSWVEPEAQLEKCPIEFEVRDWIRTHMKKVTGKDLDEEIRSGYLFGFSLSGLYKLRRTPLDTSDISILFKLPANKIRCIDDGASHLVASLNTLKSELPKGPIWNFSVGTGVGFGFTDNRHNVRNLEDFYKFFGYGPWYAQEPRTGQCVWEACSSCFGFDQIPAKQGGSIDDRTWIEFASRWKAFIESKVLRFSSVSPEKSWGTPTAIVFTGGNIDAYGNRLVHTLHELKIDIPMFTGPKGAGSLGAAWNVVTKGSDPTPLIQSILSRNIAKARQLLADGSDANERDALYNTPLSVAVTSGQLEFVKLLLKHGAEINVYDFAGYTPLMQAAQSGNLEIAQYLLNNGADNNINDYWGQSALLFAQKNNDKSMQQLIEQK